MGKGIGAEAEGTSSPVRAAGFWLWGQASGSSVVEVLRWSVYLGQGAHPGAFGLGDGSKTPPARLSCSFVVF